MPEISISELKAILKEQSRENAEQLKAVIAELKKPNVLEQRQLDAQAKELSTRQDERLANGEGVRQGIKDKRAAQRGCTHKHPTGHTHCAHVMEANGPGYILCQKCQAIIRPGTEPKGYTGNAIYDGNLFNELYQTLPTGELFG